MGSSQGWPSEKRRGKAKYAADSVKKWNNHQYLTESNHWAAAVVSWSWDSRRSGNPDQRESHEQQGSCLKGRRMVSSASLSAPSCPCDLIKPLNQKSQLVIFLCSTLDKIFSPFYFYFTSQTFGSTPVRSEIKSWKNYSIWEANWKLKTHTESNYTRFMSLELIVKTG